MRANQQRLGRALPAGTAATLVAAAALLAGCQAAQPPDYFRVVHLEGSPYDRGFEHGRRFPSEIRSLYTQMLAASVLPYLNREQPDIASVLGEYEGELYADGRFSYELMLQSAKTMERDIPEQYREEMEGIADGADLPYEDVLIMNTFLDSMLSLRSITLFIRSLEAPYVSSLSFGEGLADDGFDNDGDGEVDEEGEGTISAYEPSPTAQMAEVPPDASVRIVLVDQAGAAALFDPDSEQEAEGVDPSTIRIQVDEEFLEWDDPRISTREVETEAGTGLEVTLTPEGGFEPASEVSLILQAGDRSLVVDPPPSHARFMRDERIVFTTAGFGALPQQVESRGERDGRTQPPAIAFAARESATADGEIVMAQHFPLLDNNTCHKHTVVLFHHVDEGLDHVTVGWTGLIWGFSGMNADGLSVAVQSSDSLDMGMVIEVITNINNLSRARLLTYGMPAGIMVREVLSGATTVDEASPVLEAVTRSFGWNALLADSAGEMLAIEMDSNIFGDTDGGFFPYGPMEGDDLVSSASVGPDDLRIASHYMANTEDIAITFVDHPAAELIRPQRFWSSFYNRSLRAYYVLGDEIEQRYGALDAEGMIEVLRVPDLVDPRDSMNATVFEPTTRRLHVAMGQVPATDGEFRPFELDEIFGRGGAR